MHFTFLFFSIILVQTSVWCWAQETKSDSSSSVPSSVKKDVSDSKSALRRMHNHLIAAKDLEFTTKFSIVDKAMGRNQSGTVHYVLRKPNLLRVTATLGKKNLFLVSDGGTLIIHEANKGKYRRVPAADTIVGNLYLASGLLSIPVRMVDFFWSVDYLNFLGSVDDLADVSGVAKLTKLPAQTVGTKTCDGFNIQYSDDNWSVWLERSKIRLPCRLVSKRKDGSALTTQTNSFAWKANPTIKADAFLFVAPKGHTMVELGDRLQ